MLDINDFRKLNHPETIAITKHGKNRLTDRGISVADIINAIAYGEIIRKYEDDLPLPSCLVLGKSLNGNPIHVVISHDNEFIYLITAYYPDPELWDEGFKNKKE